MEVLAAFQFWDQAGRSLVPIHRTGRVELLDWVLLFIVNSDALDADDDIIGIASPTAVHNVLHMPKCALQTHASICNQMRRIQICCTFAITITKIMS